MTVNTHEAVTATNLRCTHPSWQIVRERGSRRRYQCTTCFHIDPWVKTREVETGKTVYTRGVKDVSLPPIKHMFDYAYFNVTELRHMAKERGLTGYSKMKKDDLVDLLQDTENLVNA